MSIVTLKTYPTATDSGVIYFKPIVAPKGGCDECRALVICKRTVSRGGFALCERVLKSELLPPSLARIVLSRELANGRA